MLVLLCTVRAVQGQNLTEVTGQVLSVEKNEPLIGVSVVVKGTTTGTTTDADGRFSLRAADNAVLVVTYLGFLSQEVAVSGRSNIQVKLQPDVKVLEEVVVTGYQTERKKDLTGAVSVVDTDDMKRQAVANPVKALQGRVAGMTVTGNGSPSSPATVRIRGIGTFNNNDPLYIIDGVPTKAGMHELNPADIESLQVLKDASAASIYGSRAGNGVIVITTKRGAKGVPQINANVYSSFSRFTTRTDMMNTEEYGRALWQANVNAGRDPNANSVSYFFDWNVDPASGRPVLNKVLVPKYLDENNTMRSSNTDWFKEISRTGVIQNYDVSMSNGTENGNYLLSLGYFKNEGVIKTSEFDRLSLRLNTDYKFFGGKIIVGENLSITKTKEVGASPMNEAMQALPIIPVRTEDGGWGGPVGGMNDRQNPVRLLEDNKHNNYDFMRLFGNLFAEAEILKGLKFRSNLGIDYGNYTHRRYQKKYTSGYLNNPNNSLDNNQSHSVKTTWSNTFNYEYAVGNHRVSALAGVEYFRDYFTTFSATRTGFELETDDFMYLDAGTGVAGVSGSGAEHVLLSYFGRTNYSFADKYLFSFTIRRDGSSRFGQNNRFGTFPAFSVGWRLSEEGFIKNNLAFVDDLKLRFGWGMTGNQEIDNNAIYNIYLANYATTAYDINGNKTGVLPSGFRLAQNANPNLRWEATTMSNLGVDFTLFNQKIYGSAEAYIRKTSDILILPPYIATLGEGGNQWVNGASMENKGLELSIGHRTEIGQLSLDLNGNIDMYRNKVTKLPASVVNAYGGNGTDQNILGRPLGSFYGYVADGLFRTQEELDAHAAQDGKGLGRIRYKDLNDDNVINSEDRTWIGRPHPDFSYGFNASARYKNFDFNFFLQGVSGIDVVNDWKFITDFWSVSETGSNKGTRLLDGWSPTNPDSDIPAISLTDANFESRFSTYFIEKGSYLKLRNAQVGYTFNPALTSRFKIQSLRVYVGGDNLGILLKSKSFTGIDPENPGYGYPNPIVGTVGANIRF